MRTSMKGLLIALILTAAAMNTISAQQAMETEEFYNNLKYITQAGPPRYVKMVTINNMAAGKSVIAEGILFTYKNRKAKDVKVAGNFSYWRPRQMDRNGNGVWYFLMDTYHGKNPVTYKFCVDGIWIHDANNQNLVDDKAGSYLSVAEPYQKKEGKQVTFRILMDGRVEFRIYRPVAKSISLVGDFNQWNPEQDLLRKGTDGIWRIRKKLYPGNHRYRFLIDGEATVDLFNPSSSSDDAGDICSLITIKK